MKKTDYDFELPPLPQASDIPITLSEIDGSSAEELSDISISDEGIKEAETVDFKSARRRESMADEEIKTSREPYAHMKKLDEFYSGKSIYTEECKKGQRRMKEFIIFFSCLAFLYLVAAPSGIAVVLILFELILALLVYIGSEQAKHYLVLFFGINAMISLMNFADAFTVLLKLYEKFFQKSFYVSNFDKGISLAAAVLSIAAGVYLIVSGPINTHCRYTEDLLDSPRDLLEYITKKIKK